MTAPSWTESLYPAYGQTLTIDEMLYEQKSDHQHLMIFRNAMFGRVLALDGVVQTTEKDEFIYHEMLTHVPLVAHGAAHGSGQRVLIIGGGDGGILREVCRHQSVSHITQVEIDAAVIEMAKQYLPDHSQGAYDDPRAHIVIGDGFDYVHHSDEFFDVIISDSTDPHGPAEVLFSQDFYRGCQQRLRSGGVLVTQNGVPFLQQSELLRTASRLQPLFRDWTFYGAAVPTYIGGIMCFAWASDDANVRQQATAALQARWDSLAIRSRYYNPALHAGAFALPQYIVDALEGVGG